MKISYHSWIPNLSSKINFKYITDEIDFDNDKIIVKDVECDECNDNKKIFSLALNSSDSLEKTNSGYNYEARIEFELQRDNSIHGNYEERLIEGKTTEDKSKFFEASFIIKESGFIELNNFIWKTSAKSSEKDKKGKILGAYNNIKYVLHKDVHHDPKEDIELGIFDNRTTYKYDILDRFILAIKAFERQIKDETKPIEKLEFLEKKFLQANGYNAYLKTYATILKREALNKIKINKINESIAIADNIIISSNFLIEQYRNKKKDSESLPFIILAIMTMFVPVLIATLALTDYKTKSIFHNILDPFYIASIYALVAIYVGHRYTSKKAIFTIYYYVAKKYKNVFMKLRIKFVSEKSKINILFTMIIALLWVSVVFFLLLTFPSAEEIVSKWLHSLYAHIIDLKNFLSNLYFFILAGK